MFKLRVGHCEMNGSFSSYGRYWKQSLPCPHLNCSVLHSGVTFSEHEARSEVCSEEFCFDLLRLIKLIIVKRYRVFIGTNWFLLEIKMWRRFSNAKWYEKALRNCRNVSIVQKNGYLWTYNIISMTLEGLFDQLFWKEGRYM